jgi:hypothetical protein
MQHLIKTSIIRNHKYVTTSIEKQHQRSFYQSNHKSISESSKTILENFIDIHLLTKIQGLERAWTYAAIDGLDAAESLDLFLAKLSLRRSLCSFNLEARSFWYSAASDLALAILFFLSAILARFLCKVNGVTNL